MFNFKCKKKSLGKKKKKVGLILNQQFGKQDYFFLEPYLVYSPQN